MSWSINAIGKPAAVQLALVKQFVGALESTKNVPPEQEAVRLCQQVVDCALDFLSAVETPPVKVSGGGSAYMQRIGAGDPENSKTRGGFNFKLEIEQLGGFVE